MCLRYMNRFNSLKHMQQFDAHNFNQKKRKNRKKKIFSLQLSEFMLQWEIVWKINRPNLAYAVFIWGIKLSKFHFYSAHKTIVYVSLKCSTKKARTLVGKWFTEKIMLNLLSVRCSFKSIRWLMMYFTYGLQWHCIDKSPQRLSFQNFGKRGRFRFVP